MEKQKVEEDKLKDNSDPKPASRKRSLEVEVKKLDSDHVKNDVVEPEKKDKRLKKDNIPRPVRRKLCFDYGGCNSSNAENTDNNKRQRGSFTADLENLLNTSLEENRKRCINKYNFDPVLEKPLEGPFVWEKVE